ncbi:unnamed protein product, partial [Ectocarpus fasciculatus]
MSSFFSSFTRSTSSALAAHECSVCLLAVNPGDAFTDPSGCGHLLHLQCFMQAREKLHAACPTCRAPFKIAAAAPPVSPPVPQPILNTQPATRATPLDDSLPQEDPLFVPAVVTPAPAAGSAAVSAEAASDPIIELAMTPEVPAVASASEQRMFVNVSTISKDCEVSEKSRVGVDLVMILDKSGSMGGEKERLLRNAVEFVVGELDERDRLCTVAFDNRAHFEHGFLGMGPAGHERALSHARGPGLRASGGTDIYDGLQKGVAALNARKASNAVTTIFLLTDGIDNRHLEEKLALARHARSMGWFMFIFAFGADHNAAHLNAIADAADSSYIFIDNLATVREAFGGAIGSQQGVAGKLLNLTIQAADPGVIIHRAAAGQYATNVSDDRRMSIITYPNLLIGEKRDCCVEVTIPASDIADVTTVLTASLTYTPSTTQSGRSTSTDKTVACVPCTVSRPTELSAPLPRNDIVDSQINRLTGIDVIERATALADANKLDEARALVAQAQSDMTTSVSASHPSTQAMVLELTECMGRLQTKREWVSVGRSEQMESYNVHKCQR